MSGLLGPDGRPLPGKYDVSPNMGASEIREGGAYPHPRLGLQELRRGGCALPLVLVALVFGWLLR
jgi:hypothetical protein